MRTMTLTILLLTTALAGCSDDGAQPVSDADDAALDNLDLSAGETTGVIRGVVVDEAIQPIAGATVTLIGTEQSTTSNDQGAFGFSDLEPGDYFVQAEKKGYETAQQSTTVQAGIVDPPAVKILLVADPSSAPQVQTTKWTGFIECSVRAVVIGVALCQDIGNDDVAHDLQLEGTPDWAQGELTWESTQALGDELSFNWRKTGTNEDYIDTEGPSPLLLQANHTLLAANEVGVSQPLRTVIFTAHNSATEPPCIPDPVEACLWGVGVQLQQEFTQFTTVFYNLVPDPDWRFLEDGEYPLPS